MGTDKKQKRARKAAGKNRYCAGAKLSEHKFLRILRGYTEGKTVQELAATTHVSAKTIRVVYGKLRAELSQAVSAEPDKFGAAGRLLAASDAGVLEAVQLSRYFRAHRKRHAPRLSCPIQERQLAIEVLVRLMCALDLRGVRFDEETMDSLVAGIAKLRPRDPPQRLAEFLPEAKVFAHADLRLYEDYRHYLLKNPMGTQ